MQKTGWGSRDTLKQMPWFPKKKGAGSRGGKKEKKVAESVGRKGRGGKKRRAKRKALVEQSFRCQGVGGGNPRLGEVGKKGSGAGIALPSKAKTSVKAGL